MCGICGYVSHKYSDESILKKMNDSMFHRGPDDQGVYVVKQDKQFVGLAQRRLSIIDLSQAGHQPMFSKDKNIALVFNGEIYNYKEIRNQLEQNYSFVSDCDTEVIIAAYEVYGKDFLKYFNGMFALALYDFHSEELILARDRIGKKPLYYYCKNDVIIFGSELKPIMLHPEFTKEIKTNIIARYMYHGYINAPDTIFENTYKLEPGMFLIYKKGSIKKECYWNLVHRYFELSKEPVSDYNEAKYGLSKLMIDSVQHRMIADVPLGTFLSGGIDSSLVSAIAQNSSSKAIKTFSIGFKEKQYDEAIYSKKIANYLGTDHTELYINQQEMFELIESIPKYFDEPVADSSQIPTMLVSKLAKNQVTVALTGDGGDELFCGYGSYETVLKHQKFEKIAALLKHITNSSINKHMKLETYLPVGVQIALTNQNNGVKSQLPFNPSLNKIYSMVRGTSNDILYNIEDQFSIKNWQQRLMLVDMLAYLPEDLLQKVDRASMKYSLESRCPILDYKIIEYSFRVPHEFKYKNGEKKYILKEILYDYLPREMLDRPKKGFSVPINKWLGTVLLDKLKHYGDKTLIEKQGIFHCNVIQEMINSFIEGANNSKFLWHYFVFQMWYNSYFESLWD
jgi:asparagine synthase (glutamine-hydrolysing)